MKPGKLGDRFGAGYALKSITLEITDEAVAENKVKTVLPWLLKYRGLYLDGTNVSNPQLGLSNNIGSGNFDTGN